MIAIEQYEFGFARDAAAKRYYEAHDEWRELVVGLAKQEAGKIAAKFPPLDGPVMARIWVIEGKRRVQRMWRVDMLHELNRHVWGWYHIR